MDAASPNRRSLATSIRERQREGRFPVISEIKVRSEKEGDLLRGRDPVALARQMTKSPIAAISVVTEPRHFGGHIDLLRAVSAAVSVPVLHKDFISTERQLRDSAEAGASAVLLITAMLEAEQLARLIGTARAYGLEPLVEAHTASELRALEPLSFELLGINNRDITILEVDDDDVGRTERLARLRAPGKLLISESSIRDARDVERAGRSGADAVLVGTSVLKASHLEVILGELTSVRWPVV